MEEYHKIKTVFKRDPDTKHKTLLEGEFSLPEFEYMQHNDWVFTEKLDGTNIRVQFNPVADAPGPHVALKFRGRSNTAQIPLHLFNHLQSTFHAEDFYKKFADEDGSPFSVCLYGEGVGPKIQKGGGNYGDSPFFVLFDVKVGDVWLARESVVDIAKYFNIPVSFRLGVGNLFEMVEYAREGFDSIFGSFTAEGIVARPKVELADRQGRRVITKIKHKDFPRE